MSINQQRAMIELGAGFSLTYMCMEWMMINPVYGDFQPFAFHLEEMAFEPRVIVLNDGMSSWVLSEEEMGSTSMMLLDYLVASCCFNSPLTFSIEACAHNRTHFCSECHK